MSYLPPTSFYCIISFLFTSFTNGYSSSNTGEHSPRCLGLQRSSCREIQNWWLDCCCNDFRFFDTIIFITSTLFFFLFLDMCILLLCRCLCISAIEACERLTTLGIAVNLVPYLTGTMHLGNAFSANTVTNFMGTLFMLCLLGGFLADTFIGRFVSLHSKNQS